MTRMTFVDWYDAEQFRGASRAVAASGWTGQEYDGHWSDAYSDWHNRNRQEVFATVCCIWGHQMIRDSVFPDMGECARCGSCNDPECCEGLVL